MLATIIISLLAMSDPTANSSCPENRQDDNYHLSNVCALWLEGAPAYSATFQASLAPGPASQQVMIYRVEGAWFMRVSGYSWKSGEAVVTRRREVNISEADARLITNQMTEIALKHFSELAYYGSKDVICTDGSSLSLAIAFNGVRHSAAQHSCAGKSEINYIAALFGSLAIKYDPEFKGLLSGLAG